ncbi:MAG: hypothetical protein C0618_04425 [Desulfuromonas sp.]|nr:MAG: hypothetical protein C0618_04425 [Desulfuromonas sp.]
MLWLLREFMKRGLNVPSIKGLSILVKRNSVVTCKDWFMTQNNLLPADIMRGDEDPDDVYETRARSVRNSGHHVMVRQSLAA